MEKNKSKSDLLAAGRKKLQQYRQKKDNKGGSSSGQQQQKQKQGKPSSNKNTKSTSAAVKTDEAIPDQQCKAEIVTPLKAVSTAEMSSAADMDGSILHKMEQPTPSKDVPFAVAEETSVNLPAIDSLVKLAGGVSEYTDKSEQEPIPGEINSLTASRQIDGVWHVGESERVDCSALSVDTEHFSSDTCVGAMQGASCSSMDQHNENYNDGCEPVLQGGTTHFRDILVDSEKNGAGVHISEAGVMEGDASTFQCSLPEGAYQHDVAIYLEQVTAKAEENASSSRFCLQNEPLVHENERYNCLSTSANVDTGLGELQGDPSTEAHDILSYESNHETEGSCGPSSLNLTVETSTVAEENASGSLVSLETESLINETVDERESFSSTPENVGTGLGKLKGDPFLDVNQRSTSDQEVYDDQSSKDNHEMEGNHVSSSLTVEISKEIDGRDKVSDVAMYYGVDNRTMMYDDACINAQHDGAQELHINQRSSTDHEVHVIQSSQSNHVMEGNHVSSYLAVEIPKEMNEVDKASDVAMDHVVDNRTMMHDNACINTQIDGAQDLHINQRANADQEVYDAQLSENNHEMEQNHVLSTLIVEIPKEIDEIYKASDVAMDYVVDNRTMMHGVACLNTQLDGAQELRSFCTLSGALPKSENHMVCEKKTDISSSETSVIQYESREGISNDSNIAAKHVTKEVNKGVNFQENFENDSGLGLENFMPAAVVYDLGQQKDSQQKLSVSTISTEFGDKQDIITSVGCSVDEIECLKRHLYLTNLTKNFLSLQIEEQLDAYLGNDAHFSDELSRAHVLVKDSQDQSTNAQKEVSDCKSELQIMTLKNEELENNLALARGEVETLNIMASEFQNKFDECQEGSAILLAELVECKGLLGDLKMENSRLKSDIILETDERKKLNNERDYLIHENRRLTSELLEQKEQLDLAHNKQIQLDNELKESTEFLEHLIMENFSLSTSLNVLRFKLEDLNDLHQPLSQGSDGQLRSSDVQDLISEKPTYKDNCEEESHLHGLKDSVSTDVGHQFVQKSVYKNSGEVGAFLTLKGHLNELENIVDKTENIIYSLHSQSMSLSESSNKMSASGVSKLIQAFETKVSIDVNSPAIPIEGEKSADSLIFAKEQTRDLRAILEKFDVDVDKVATLFKTCQESTLSFQEVDMDPASCKLRIDDFKVKYDELVNRLNDYDPMVDKLQNQINNVSENAEKEAGHFFNQMDFLHKEVDKFLTVLESEKDLVRNSIYQAFEKLDASTGLPVSSNLDICSHVNASVGTTVKVIDDLREKLGGVCMELDTKCSAYETLFKDHVEMQKMEEFAVAILLGTCNSLKKLVKDPYEVELDEIINEDSGDKLEILQHNNEILIGRLKKLLDDRLLLLNAKCELESDLHDRKQHEDELKERYIVISSNLEYLLLFKVELETMLMEKNHEMEGIKNRCFALCKVLDDHKMDTLYTDVFDSRGNSCSTLSDLEASVVCLCQKYGEAAEQISLSKEYLKEMISLPEALDQFSLPLHVLLCQELNPKLKELSDLQEKNHMLSSSILQQENEVHSLKESMVNLEEALESSHSALHVKVTELEESEQRLSTVREKLSIAVAKGKGLVAQRDSLKQSLLEKSAEFEKCLQELQSKEAMLHEAEAKLKLYSEADRVEALESELSYIRSSATVFRDSFLQKDSILQRIEEVLEDLDLPEHFHLKDIPEKIEFLARSVTGKPSFLLTDEEQKNDEDQQNSLGVSYPDPGPSVVNPWTEDLQATPSTELHNLRMKCEEIQNKYYALAEQNDMLEQSLMETNKVVQWWEEVVDRIEMPSNLRPVSPEFKFEWLIDTLSEMRQERDSLLLKTDNQMASIVSLEATSNESQSKLYELNSELAKVKCEKEFLSESLDKLRHETLEFSDKAIQDEDEKSCLQKDIEYLKEKLAEVNRDYHDLSNEIAKLRDLVCDALPDISEVDTSTGDGHTKDLERHLVKLVDNYKMLNLENSAAQGSVICASGECTITPEEQKRKDMLEEECNLMLLNMKTQLEKVTHDLVLMKDEKDTIAEKLHSLISEMEATTKLKNVLLEERDIAINKYDCLVLEMNTLCKKSDTLQEQLNQEEQRSASLKEKLNMAVKKGKALVQQRDSLKRTIEERTTELKQLENELNQRASENLSLGNKLAQAEHSLLDSQQTLSSLSEVLHSIEIGEEISILDPIQKFKEFVKLSSDWHAAAISHEHEAKKARRASDLLLAELNEVQERADILQEDLSKAETVLAEYSKERDALESARVSALSQLEHFMAISSEERNKAIANIKLFEAGIFDLRKLCFNISHLLSRTFFVDSNFFGKLETSAQSILKLANGVSAPEQSAFSGNLQVNNILNEEESPGASELFNSESVDDTSISERLVLSTRCLHECLEELGDLIERVHKHSYDTEQQARSLSTLMYDIERDMTSQKLYSDTLMSKMHHHEIVKNQKEDEIIYLQRNLALLYETCRRSIMEIENRKARAIRKDIDSGVDLSHKMVALLELPDCFGEEALGKHNPSFMENGIKKLSDILWSAVEGLGTLEEHISEDNQKKLKFMISDLKRELQDKDTQKNRICGELVSQVRDAENAAKKYSEDLDSARYVIENLENKVKVLENHKESMEASSNDFQQKIRLMTNAINKKGQEIEELTQALDEEESQLEELESRNQLLEKLVEEKTLSLESLETSRTKAVAKLSTTVGKFDELHSLSESLLAEVENLQYQVQEKDLDISFLRQEVTRCTKDVLAEQEINKQNLIKTCQLQEWLSTIASRFGVQDMYSSDEKHIQSHECTEVLDKQVSCIVSKLDELQKSCQNKDALLQLERTKIEECLNKMKSLESSLHEKESQLALFHRGRDSGQASAANSAEPMEIETVRNEGVVLSSVAPLIRGGRKANSDHVAIGIDLEQENMIQDEDDDKAHGFKALTMSRVVPKAARPITDKIDGLWVSIERLLMRQPSLRLVLIIYWVALHTMLAASI